MNILYRQVNIDNMIRLSGANEQEQVVVDNLIFSLNKNPNY